jgi:hypothetical protein
VSLVFHARYVAAFGASKSGGPRTTTCTVCDASGAKAIVTAVAKVSGSWLDGPGGSRGSSTGTGPDAAGSPTYPGERLGLPAQGPRSVAGFGRRLAALLVDWMIAVLIVTPLTGHRPFTPGSNSPWILAVFAAEYVVLVSLIGRTIGMRLFGIGIIRLDGRRVSFPWVVVRTLLLLIVVPAVIYDRDQRGLHDKAADCVVVRV